METSKACYLTALGSVSVSFRQLLLCYCVEVSIYVKTKKKTFHQNFYECLYSEQNQKKSALMQVYTQFH